MTTGQETTALLVIDVQKGFDEPTWGRRNQPSCETNIARLLEHWRARSCGPVIFVRHDSAETGSPLAPGTPGNSFKDVITGEPDLLVTKRVHSAFHGSPDLASWLGEQGVRRIVVCGITSNHCCETTTRVGCDLGFDMTFAADATHAFDRPGVDGQLIAADALQRVTEANLAEEFASVKTTREILDATGIELGPHANM